MSNCPKCGSKLWFNIASDISRKYNYKECAACGHTEGKTIRTVDARKLMEYTDTLARHLTKSEFSEIIAIYQKVLDRLDGGLVSDNEK